MAGSTIGQTAARHRVPEHVLRHWEDVGALRPQRTSSGHRRYLAEYDCQIELIQCGKAAGLSLGEIAVMLHGPVDLRAPLLSRRLVVLEREALEIEASVRMLRHVSVCDAIGSCSKCAMPHETFRYPLVEQAR
ncbi:DNA-binding transcriptional MerR regulator [Leucobacter exalbidus]|uniref:DNA-binding transcriptional MerR regulator n=1 Tax=Leucobacter exalbidus TaxID=662960 RepID=A0A940PSE9_9MICO|nr:MerR family transcriptional regulator [Leucobacter exalbidus]MBP1325917.1 DNA-binding transcriptional MerR regulator [Leucobacter exalbidus]